MKKIRQVPSADIARAMLLAYKKNEARKKGRVVSAKRLLVIAAIGASVSSCGGFYAGIGTTAAIRANNDYATGIINETRTPAGTKGSHYQFREKQSSNGFMPSLRGLFQRKGGQ